MHRRMHSGGEPVTYYKVVALMCDGAGCSATYQYDRSSATEARQNARKTGWINEGSEDYCPNCAEEVESR